MSDSKSHKRRTGRRFHQEAINSGVQVFRDWESHIENAAKFWGDEIAMARMEDEAMIHEVVEAVLNYQPREGNRRSKRV
jgi:hypothetical protein